MNKTQKIVLISALALFLLSFLFLNTKKEKGSTPKMEAMQKPETPVYNFEDYIAKAKANMKDSESQKKINELEKENSSLSFEKLAAIYHTKGEAIMEAHYTKLAAFKKDDDKMTERAADLFVSTAALSTEEGLRHYLGENAVLCLKKLSEKYPNNTDYKLHLGEAYIEFSQNPMEGVTLLREIVTKDSMNAQAQFLLGKFGVVSGQYEKAIIRLEKVIYLQPQNVEALFLCAMCYKETGNKTKALNYLDRCIQHQKDESLKKELEQYKKEILAEMPQ